MPTGTRVRKHPPPPLWLPTDHQFWTGLPVPDPITFIVSPKWLDRPLYPRQATLVKVIFLRTDLLTDYDREVIAEWESNFLLTGNNGILPNVIERMTYLRERGYKWFREVLLVMGRRAGKGYVCALAMSYVLWNYMATGDPQDHYGIDRSKQLTCLIYAGRKEQARDNLWRDLYNVVKDAPCFAPYRSRMMGESFSVYAPADFRKMQKLARRGIVSGLDMATFKIDPLPATPMSGRGGAGFMIGFDEFGHMVATGANRSGQEVYDAATPSLDQFGKDAFIVAPSSPWEMIGQFYLCWQQSMEIGLDGEPMYPEKVMLQLTSWDIYLDWAIAHEIELFPADFTGDLDEYLEAPLLQLSQLDKALTEYDDAMKRLEKADPDMFSVERMAHWQTSLDAYLDPKMIDKMWEGGALLRNDPNPGALGTFYKGHGDPSLVNDNFGLAVAHTEKDAEGLDVAVFDYIHHWDPADWPEHTLDYVQINEELWSLIRAFPIDDFSFDQYNSNYFIADLSQRAMKASLPKRISVHMVPSVATRNLRVAETFKVALNQGWVKAPMYEQADLELRFLQFKNGKVTHQTAGPVQHDDVARAMMEVVWGLLERQVATFLTAGVQPLSGTSIGGNRPWMSPPSQDEQVFAQFGQARTPRVGAEFSPARGRPEFTNRPPRSPRRWGS